MGINAHGNNALHFYRKRFMAFLISMIMVLSLLSICNLSHVYGETKDPLKVATISNGDFETPIINTAAGWQNVVNGTSGLFWTSSANGVEIIKDKSTGHPEQTPYSGNQFAEVNGEGADTVFQSIDTVPGQVLTWSLAHKARTGNSNMNVKIDAAKVPLDSMKIADTFTTDDAAWITYLGTYTVPKNQTGTRFALEALDQQNHGNYVDNVEFQTLLAVKSTNANVGDPKIDLSGYYKDGTSSQPLYYKVGLSGKVHSLDIKIDDKSKFDKNVELDPTELKIGGNTLYVSYDKAMKESSTAFTDFQVFPKLDADTVTLKVDGTTVVEGSKVTVGSKVVFTAESIGSGANKWVPVSWVASNGQKGNFATEPYVGYIDVLEKKDITIEIDYQGRLYEGDSYSETGDSDMISKTIRVKEASNDNNKKVTVSKVDDNGNHVTTPSVSGTSGAIHDKSAETGDNFNLLPIILICIAAVIVILIIAAKGKKKKK